MRIAVTCGYPRSLHTIALIHQLAARGHTVALCLRVRMLDWQRLRFYVRQLGWRRFISKVRHKLGRGATAHTDAPGEVAPMLGYLRELGVKSASTTAACRAVGASEAVVPSLNHPRALVALRAANIDLVVYSGGGLLRRDFLSIPRLGVLNAHGGPLPGFRGMNAAEWALFHGVRPTLSVHFIDHGVDTGPVLFDREIPLAPWRGIPHMRGAATRVGVESLLDAVDAVAASTHTTAAQPPEHGRQYFVMAEPLLEILAEWMNGQHAASRAACDFQHAPLCPGGRP